MDAYENGTQPMCMRVQERNQLHFTPLANALLFDENTNCLLVKRFLDRSEGGIVLSFVPNETPVEDVDVSFTGLDVQHLQIWGPCNGVVCLTRSAFNSTIVLWNPSMKEFRVLPQPSHKSDHMSNLGFGYDPYTDDYKVVRFAMLGTDLSIRGLDETIEIYDLRTDSWRKVDAESPAKSGLHCFYDPYASGDGDCFWYAHPQHGYPRQGDGPVIMAFSMSNEVFEELPVPEVCLLDEHSHSEQKLFVLDDSLAMVIYPKGGVNPFLIPPEEFSIQKSFDIWIMNEEDVEVSWTKNFTIGPLQGLDWALGFRLNGEFLVESSNGQMMSYNLNTQERKEYEVHDQVRGHPPPPNLQVIPYTHSLVSVRRQQ
ncbi:F-box/kelch-repeat protein At3g06240-like [Rhododendron vialii]|uniref:F-box/kelch-repeat protein At3g06240-like n=1 Tax=Rhododendron vialii TaxID=182163 RepID=UPI00265F51C6|nr:F-box/kelch-repeat protein At3g06240-like [Rhododendron vialii]